MNRRRALGLLLGGVVGGVACATKGLPVMRPPAPVTYPWPMAANIYSPYDATLHDLMQIHIHKAACAANIRVSKEMLR